MSGTPRSDSALNAARFKWHEAVIKDQRLSRNTMAIRLAGYILHRFHPRYGFAQFSSNSAAAFFDVDPRQIKRAKKLLVRQGWIRLIETQVSPKSWQAERYGLAGGPEDRDFSVEAGDGPVTQG
jgi:hypothetical protein